MKVLAPINRLIEKLIAAKLVKRNAKGLPVATARKDLVNFSHYEILQFYN